MDDIEMDDFGKLGEDREDRDNDYDWDDWQETTFNHPDDDFGVRENLDAMKEADRELGLGLGAKKRTVTETKKAILWELGIKVRKGDGPNTKSLLERLRLTEGKKGNVNGVEFDGVKIIVLEGKTMRFTKNIKSASKLKEFDALAREAKKEHEKTAVALIEDSVPGVFVDDSLVDSVLSNSLERLNEEISERANENTVELTENEIREFRGILTARLPTLEQQREGGITVKGRIDVIKTEETHWRDMAERQNNPEKKLLYESVADVAALKADELRLRANVRPESELGQNIVEEESENNDMTRLERFKRWAKKNLGSISIVAISVAGIITIIVMGARTVVKKVLTPRASLQKLSEK